MSFILANSNKSIKRSFNYRSNLIHYAESPVQARRMFRVNNFLASAGKQMIYLNDEPGCLFQIAFERSRVIQIEGLFDGVAVNVDRKG